MGICSNMLRKGTVAASGSGIRDPFFANVSLLLRMDGSNESTIFLDSSKNALSVMANGSTLPSISTAIESPYQKFKQVGRFAVSATNTRYLTVANSSLFAFGLGDFTVEFFCYRTIAANICRFITNGGFAFEMGDQTNATKWMRGGTVIFQRTGAPAINQWVHVAICRHNNTVRLFYNGVEQASGSDSGNYATTTGTLYIGDFPTINQFAYVGYLDCFRITNGIARYITNFNPQTLFF